MIFGSGQRIPDFLRRRINGAPGSAFLKESRRYYAGATNLTG
jgi:hypothetical protein